MNHDRSGLWAEPLDEFQWEPQAPTPPTPTEALPVSFVVSATPVAVAVATAPPHVALKDRSELWLFASGSIFGALACWILVALTTSAQPQSEPVVDTPAPVSASAPAVPETSEEAVPANRSVTVPSAPPVVEKASQVPALTARRQDVRQVPIASPRTQSRNGSFVGSLRIDSTPSGARVFIDRQAAGVTPLVVPDLRAGSHAVRVEADGHMPWSSAIRVVADRQTFVHSPLTPLAISPGPR